MDALSNQNVDRSIIDFKRIARNLMKILLQISPIIIVIFVWLPQYVQKNPFNFQSRRASIGLSDSLRPGSISSLISSNEMFFMARTQAKPQESLYWKTRYLDYQFGMKWLESRLSKEASKQIPSEQENGTKVEIFSLNNDFDRLPFLKNILKKNSDILNLEGGSYELISPRSSSQIYSYGDKTTVLNKKINYLQTEDIASYRARKLAREIKHLFKSDPNKTISYLKRYLVNNRFSYTLEPREKSKTIDTFLFKDKTGYCEHYASAFSYLLRKIGIKSRVVLGFQGGTYNQQLKFYTLYSRDAHAWIEYWDGQTWKRFDPTYMIAPSRIDKGFNYFYRKQILGEDLLSKITLPLVWFVQDVLELIRNNFQFSLSVIFDAFSDKQWLQIFLGFVDTNSTEILMLLLLGLFWFILKKSPKKATYKKECYAICPLLQKKDTLRPRMKVIESSLNE